MKQSDLVRDTLGEHIYSCYMDAEQKEWNQYAETVHNWEIKQYLEKF
ncbi:MAG: hypothetical protein H0Z40_11450 [Desulfotomaculum sp.]|nr:hypothetical protein [Desulfotomaculum sp.]